MKTAKDFDHVLITDEDGRPMAWSEEQLCYCESDNWEDEPFPVVIYKRSTAKAYMRRANKWRKAQGFKENKYQLYPAR